VAARGKLLADFQRGGDTESYTHNPGLILLPTVAEELGQQVSHGVCKQSGSSSKLKRGWPTQLCCSLFLQPLEAKSRERLLLPSSGFTPPHVG